MPVNPLLSPCLRSSQLTSLSDRLLWSSVQKVWLYLLLIWWGATYCRKCNDSWMRIKCDTYLHLTQSWRTNNYGGYAMQLFMNLPRSCVQWAFSLFFSLWPADQRRSLQFCEWWGVKFTNTMSQDCYSFTVTILGPWRKSSLLEQFTAFDSGISSCAKIRWPSFLR